MGCNSSRELSLVGMIKGMMSINIHGSSHIKIKSNTYMKKRLLFSYYTTTQLKSVCQNASVSKAVKD